MERVSADLAALQVSERMRNIKLETCRAAAVQKLQLLTSHSRLFPNQFTNSHTQSSIKRDPDGYVEEFEMQVKKRLFSRSD